MPLPINWDDADVVPVGGSLTLPGVYLLEVVEATSKDSQAGDAMVQVDFAVCGHDLRRPVRDYFMLAGKMAWSGPKKLQALGFVKGASVEAGELVGRRVYGALISESRTGNNGKRYTDPKVDNRAEGSTCGFWREDAPPAGFERRSEGSLADVIDQTNKPDPNEIPF